MRAVFVFRRRTAYCAANVPGVDRQTNRMGALWLDHYVWLRKAPRRKVKWEIPDEAGLGRHHQSAQVDPSNRVLSALPLGIAWRCHMQHWLGGAIVCSFLILGSQSVASELDAGKALARKHLCFDCHGLSGNSDLFNEKAPYVPKLAGQPAGYLVKEMKAYRSGSRQDKLMSPIMRSRTDAEIDLMAAYFAAQKRY